MENREVQTEITMSDQMSSVEKSMRNNLRSVSSFTTKKCCIYKVPEYVRKEREECYRPLTVSIGPVHYKDPKLEDMQEVKWIYLKCFLEYNTNNSFGFYIDTIRKREQEIRVCYQHKISLRSDDFIEMILLDAAFIIYYFMEVYYYFTIKSPPLEDWQKFLRILSSRDLLLMENQLPFFILEDLHLKVFGTNDVSFKDVTHKYMAKFDMIFGDGIVNNKDAIERMKKKSDIKNLIDFVQICYSPTDELVYDVGDSHSNLPKSMTVKDLHAAGVKFVASDRENPLDIKFDKNNGVLLIPKIGFNNYTESILRNVLYYDQCHNTGADYFNDYIYFLKTLIYTVEDAEILVESGVIIDKELNNECVVDILNKIDPTYYPWKFNYRAIQRDLVKYANIPWNRWKAILKRDYFQHPWAIISVIFAVIIFILTLLQTISGFIKK